MSDSLTLGHSPRFAFAATAPADADLMAETGRALPSGWWLLPAAVTGAGMWVGLFMLIF